MDSPQWTVPVDWVFQPYLCTNAVLAMLTPHAMVLQGTTCMASCEQLLQQKMNKDKADVWQT